MYENEQDYVERIGEDMAEQLAAIFERSDAIRAAIHALTVMGVVIVYWDDTQVRRATPELAPDTPL